MTEAAWYRDRDARVLIRLGYLPWLAGLHLAWEIAHTPLYTIRVDASPGYIAFAILHCTLGDVLIGVTALAAALLVSRAGRLAHWRWGRIVALTVIFGVGYTVFSEWMNITVLRTWSYGESMPTIALGAFRVGLSPLAQWLVVPPLALYSARRSAGKAARAPARAP
jgi:hypothetical protein